MAHADLHQSEQPQDRGCGAEAGIDDCCAAAPGSAASAPVVRGSRIFKVRGMDCAEEVAVLRQAVGPAVGGADRLAFDVLNGRMTIAEAAGTVPDDVIRKAVAATGMSAVPWDA